MVTLQTQLINEARKLGFKKSWSTTSGGVTTKEYNKSYSDRKIDIQFWGDGQHRVCLSTVNGSTNVPPVDFVDLQGMLAGISFQENNNNIIEFQKQLKKNSLPLHDKTCAIIISCDNCNCSNQGS